MSRAEKSPQTTLHTRSCLYKPGTKSFTWETVGVPPIRVGLASQKGHSD